MSKKDTKNEVLARLVEFKNSTGLSVNAFSSTIGMGHTTLFSQVNGQRSLSLDTILNTIEAYDSLSAEWLLRGKGDMKLSDSPLLDSKADSRIEALIDTIALLQATIRTKNETIDTLQAELSKYKNKSKKA
jgi:plasmid maintenance system antidote protein VapI